ncbi:MAG: TraR/DksA C4-type zinc finger protein [Alphaproteobacteria bacterium]|nr:TraR/DksA C4-type zinc finger protein [Alphaproteobacteria bacterium]
MDVADLASGLIERTRADGIARVTDALAAEGADLCIGCGDAIEPTRRAALPSARRCIECQTRVERRDAGRACAPGQPSARRRSSPPADQRKRDL